MAITQISQLTVRQGLQENLPVLAGGEFGWSYDQRRLFIGNGANATTVGNTEILTEVSDIMSLLGTYTYSGLEYGYVSITGNPSTVRTLQDKLDDNTNCRDFNIQPNGQDMSLQFNTAISQLYQFALSSNNPAIRRILHLAPGVYTLNADCIRVLPFVHIHGAGKNSTFIVQQNTNLPTVVLTDSVGRIGANIGANSALMPSCVYLEHMSLVNQGNSNVLQVDSGQSSTMFEVAFSGNISPQTTSSNGACVQFYSSVAPTSHIKFLNCDFNGKSYGIQSNSAISNIVVSNADFDNLYQGANIAAQYTSSIVTTFSGNVSTVNTLTPNTSACSVKFISSSFENIYGEAITTQYSIGGSQDIISAFNTFNNVGNNFGNTSVTNILDLSGDNSYSVGDFFDRSLGDPILAINLNNTLSFATSPHGTMILGQEYLVGGRNQTIMDDGNGNIGLLQWDTVSPLSINYSIVRGMDIRTGILKIIPYSGNILYEEEYFETADIGVTITPQYTSNNFVLLNYQSSWRGYTASFTMSSSSLSLGVSTSTSTSTN